MRMEDHKRTGCLYTDGVKGQGGGGGKRVGAMKSRDGWYYGKEGWGPWKIKGCGHLYSSFSSLRSSPRPNLRVLHAHLVARFFACVENINEAVNSLVHRDFHNFSLFTSENCTETIIARPTYGLVNICIFTDANECPPRLQRKIGNYSLINIQILEKMIKINLPLFRLLQM